MGEEQSRRDSSHARAHFLITEAETGHVFADLALSTSDDAKRSRNATNARTAYDSVLAYRDAAQLSNDAAEELESKMKLLRSKLLQLGEAV